MKDTNKVRKYLLLKLSQFSKLYSIVNKLENYISLKCFHLGNGEYDFFYCIDLDSLFLTQTKITNYKKFFPEKGTVNLSNILKIRDSYILDNYNELSIINQLYKQIESDTMADITPTRLKLVNELYKNLNNECDTK